MSTLIDHKKENYAKEGEVDAAARLGHQAEQYLEAGEIAKAKESFQAASQSVLGQMAAYKQRPDKKFDEMTYDMLKATADDYRRKAKLYDLRQKSGIDQVKERLKQLKKTHRDKQAAERKGQALPEDKHAASPYDLLVRKMQQQMLLIKADVVQGLYDSFQTVLTQQIKAAEMVLENLQNNVAQMRNLQMLQKTTLTSQQSLDQSVMLCGSNQPSQDKFLNVNNPFSGGAKQQILQSSNQIEQISKQTQQALKNVQVDLETQINKLKLANKQCKKHFESRVVKVFEKEIVNNIFDLNMAQLYSLGSTPIGKQLQLSQRLFDRDELAVLDSMGSEEQLRDLEESIMMNASYAPRAQGAAAFPSPFSQMAQKGDPDRHGGGGLMDYRQIKQNLKPEISGEALEMRQKVQILKNEKKKLEDQNAKLIKSLKRYQKANIK